MVLPTRLVGKVFSVTSTLLYRRSTMVSTLVIVQEPHFPDELVRIKLELTSDPQLLPLELSTSQIQSLSRTFGVTDSAKVSTTPSSRSIYDVLSSSGPA